MIFFDWEVGNIVILDNELMICFVMLIDLLLILLCVDEVDLEVVYNVVVECLLMIYFCLFKIILIDYF